MTIKLYDKMPYETSFASTVCACTELTDGNYDLLLDATLFFPEEGGQTCDKGMINDIPVLDVQIDGEGIIHHTITKPLESGQTVTGSINWRHRFNNMQQHTGEHIFSGIVNQRFGYNNIGFHLSDSEVTMDYDGVLSKDQIREVEYAVNQAISENIPVRAWYPEKDLLSTLSYRSKIDIQGAVRIVEIEGYDRCACCAPHVRCTGEIGILKVISSQNQKGGTRLSILCGFRALQAFSLLQDAANAVSHAYSVPATEEAFQAAIDQKQEAYTKLKARQEKLEKAYMDELLTSNKKAGANILLFVNEINDILKRSTLNELVTEIDGYAGIFDGDDENGYAFIIASSKKNANDPVKAMKQYFDARGGGKPVMVQGRVLAAREQIEKLFSTL